VLAVVDAVGGHIIAWADDWEVSGETDPMTRPKLGPWLRGERGPYDGIAGAAVDRLGRNLVDCLNVATCCGTPASCYRFHSQCTGLQSGGEANLRTALTSDVSTDRQC
jgi:hypothetical protein